MTETEVYTRIEKFSGLKMDWRLWSEVFKAKMISKDYWEVIDLKPDEIPSKPTTEDEKKLNKKNMKAYSELISSIDMKTPQGRVALNLVVSSKSTAYPNGNCSTAWKKLTRKYEPVTIAELTREKTSYINYRFAQGGDPDFFIDMMERKVSRLGELGYDVSTSDLIIDIISKLPNEYDIIIEKISDKMDAKEDPEIILEFARDRLRAKYERLNPYKQSRKGNQETFREPDKALFMGATKIICFRCGRAGHKSYKCSGTNDVCKTCGKTGHLQNVCQNNPNRVNQSKQGHGKYQASNNNQSRNNQNRNQSKTQIYQGDMKDQTDQAEIILAALVPQNQSKAIPNNWWMADTGASSHMVKSKKGLTEIEPCEIPIQVGNGQKVIAKEKGTIMLQVKNGIQDYNITLKNVLYVPDLIINIISLTRVIDLGFDVISDKKQIAIKHGGTIIRFDKRLITTTGHVQYFEANEMKESKDNYSSSTNQDSNEVVKPKSRDKEEDQVHVTFAPGTSFNIEKIHSILGHANERTCQETATHYGWKVTGKLNVCANCAEAKAKQHPVSKEIKERANLPGERLFVDIQPIRKESAGGSRNWILIVDDHSDYCMSHFTKSRDELSETMLKVIKILQERYMMNVKFIRMDNAGENKSLMQMLEEKYPKIYVEFTAPGTPQQNGRVEKKFDTLIGYARAILNEAGFDVMLRNKLWAEAASFVTTTHNLLVKEGMTPYEKFYTSKPSIVDDELRSFGELAVITKRKGTIQPKFDNRGRTCVFIGYTKGPTRTFRFLDLKTMSAIHSRDIRWLNRFYKDIKNNYNLKQFEELQEEEEERENTTANDYEVENITRVTDDEKDQEDDEEEIIFLNEEEENQQREELFENYSDLEEQETGLNEETSSKRGWKKEGKYELKNLATSYNETNQNIQQGRTLRSGRELGNQEQLSTLISDQIHGMIDLRNDPSFAYDFAMMILASFEETDPEIAKEKIQEKHKRNPMFFADIYDCPGNYNQAWNHEDKFQRDKWREAISKELEKMEKKKVWVKINKQEMEQERKPIKCKWVFMIKRNGTFRARLVACGYSQIPGIDFDESYAPVVNDVTYRVMIIISIMLELSPGLIDVEVAFLHGELEETIYMECPQGIQHNGNQVLHLKKTLYGLVQAARQFYKKWKEVLEKIGFKQSLVDPCLFKKEGPIYLGAYVDDNLILGKEETPKWLAKEVQKQGMEVKIEEGLQDYLSCNIIMSKDKKRAWIGQPHLIKKLKKKFGKRIQQMKKTFTPGTPGQGLQEIIEGQEEKLNDEEQKVYRSGVGMLLYLVKHSRPDIANPTRELAKGMQSASKRMMKELLRVIRFISDTPTTGLHMYPKEMKDNKWYLKLYTDSDWAGDKDKRKSISGYTVFFCGCPILWKSKAQGHVTHSSGEAEYVALSEASKDIKFVYMLLQSMDIYIKLPIIVRIDNIAAKFMAETASASSRTKHIDVKYHYVREFVEQGFIKIIYIATEENISDMFTKNIKKELHEKHSRKFVIEKDKMDKHFDSCPVNMRKGVGTMNYEIPYSQDLNQIMIEDEETEKNDNDKGTEE